MDAGQLDVKTSTAIWAAGPQPSVGLQLVSVSAIEYESAIGRGMRGVGRLPGMATIPSNFVDTAAVRPHERFALWRTVLAATHEAELPEDSDPATFSASARGWYLGHSLVFETRATAPAPGRCSAARDRASTGCDRCSA
jgi:hypothetical protein